MKKCQKCKWRTAFLTPFDNYPWWRCEICHRLIKMRDNNEQ